MQTVLSLLRFHHKKISVNSSLQNKLRLADTCFRTSSPVFLLLLRMHRLNVPNCRLHIMLLPLNIVENAIYIPVHSIGSSWLVDVMKPHSLHIFHYEYCCKIKVIA